MLFVSVWHGVWPGYYLCFSLEMTEIMAERAVSIIDLLTEKQPPLFSVHQGCNALVRVFTARYAAGGESTVDTGCLQHNELATSVPNGTVHGVDLGELL